MNQSELKANKCNRRQARENATHKSMVGFGCASIWLRKWREFYKPKQSEVKQNQRIYELLSTPN